MAKRGVLNSGGEVGHQREAEHLHTCLACRNRLESGRHSNQVTAKVLDHLNFGRGLIVRAAKLHINAFVELGIHASGHVAQALRVQVGQVDEGCALERAGRGQVDVVADQHSGARLPGGLDAARAVGQNHRGCSRCSRGTNTVHHAPNSVALVKVGSCAENQSVLAVWQGDRANRGNVAFDHRCRKAWNVGGVDAGHRLTD